MIDGIQPPRQRGKISLRRESEATDEPTFQPPEVVAEQDEVQGNTPEPVETTGATPTWQKAGVKSKKSRFAFLKNLSKKQIIILSVIGVLLVGGASALVLTRKKPTPPPKPAPVAKKVVVPPKPTTVASTLSGLQVPPESNLLPVTGIMIENSPDARPQSGLSQASVVFEAIAEGGITRFLTLWQDNHPDYVGPVRSVRLYYLQWLQGFDAPVAHVGGAPEALSYIKSAGLKDLDQFYNSGPYHRISARYAPHNMYTDVNKLIDLEKTKGWTSSTFTGFTRKAKEAPSATPTAKGIDVAISGPLYNVHYDYDATTNSYLRSEGGKPHTDEVTGKQLSPKVAIAIVVPYSIQSDGIHSQYQVIGSGKAYIFQDGNVIEGIWEKTAGNSQIRFGDANGSPLAINPGQTWITAVGAASNVSYRP